MEIVKHISQMKQIVSKIKLKGLSLGFVPTMGYFHEGHLSLMRKAKSECDKLVVSIFVNPIQFGPKEDYKEYPRDIERDKKLAEEIGVDYLFIPEVNEMYPEGYKTYVVVEEITEVLCGKFRPSHFKGVATVVTKLFNIVKPDKAYFGQKDAQQAIIIKQMVKDLNMDVEIIVCPIIREKDGLAMSSRNIYLSEKERKIAPMLYQSLLKIKDLYEKGEKRCDFLVKEALKFLEKEPLIKVEYLEIRDSETLEELKIAKSKALVAIAAKIGKARLIDNILL